MAGTGSTATTAESPTVRLYAKHVPAWQRFQTDLMVPTNQAANKVSTTTVHPYQRQYAHVYNQRLAVLGPLVRKRMDDANNDKKQGAVEVPRILELREDVESSIVGTLVVEKEQDDQKAAYLEDDSGRVALVFPEKGAGCGSNFTPCTGIVLGLVGTVGVDGVMKVSKIFTASQVETLEELQVVPINSKDNEAPYVLLVSGLECGSPRASSLTRDMLVGFIHGQFGRGANKITNVIVAGGLVSADPSATTNGSRELDGFAWQLTSAGVPVTVLPGKDDPTTANWPQRPIHKSLMPRSSNHLLSRAPNPCAVKLSTSDTDAKAVLGTDGTNVLDLAALTNCSELDALQKTVEYAHVCPTGPNSVPTMPHTETDPMVLTHDKVPKLYFAGNCSAFATRLIQVKNNNGGGGETTTCRLVCLPKFLETGTACLVNLETLTTELVRFEE